MEYDYSKLRGRIRELYGSERNFADKIKMNRSTLSLKCGNKSEFTQSEIFRILNALNLTAADIENYFFTPMVEKTQQIGRGDNNDV
nr:MAG TPA: Protein of unknown function (DUF739) [Bacteriophage sp.]